MGLLTSSQATFTNLEEYSEIIIGTQTASTGAWTGKANLLPPLKDGQQITYWLPYAGSGNATLNLTLADGSSTGAVNCYYSGTTRLTTHYAAGNAIHMTYRKDAVIAGSSTKYTGWWADANYTTGDNNQLRIANSIKAKTAITANRLIVGDSNGFFHLAAGVAFDVNKPIVYRTAALSAGSTSTSSNYISYSNVALANNLTGFTGTNGESCYIVGTLNGTVFTPATDFFTTTQPTEADGNVYILLGLMVSTTNCSLYPEHPMFRYSGDGFKSFGQIAYEAQEQADENAEAIGDVDSLVHECYAAISKTSSEIMSEVRETYISKTDLETVRRDFETSITQNSKEIRMDFTTITDEIKDNVASNQQLIEEYIRFRGALIELGKVGNSFTAELSNEQLAFKENGQTIAYISNQSLVITNAEIRYKLSLGTEERGWFDFIPRSSGNLSIVWRGATTS